MESKKKNDANELIYKTETEQQTSKKKKNLWLRNGKYVWEDKLGV